MKNIDIKYLGEQLTFNEGSKIYYMELTTRKDKRIFPVEINDRTKQLKTINNEIIFNLTQLVKRKLVNELKEGRKLKDIVEVGIKLEADALINKAS
jgi:hypothetical protein